MISHAEKYELLVKNQGIESIGFNLKNEGEDDFSNEDERACEDGPALEDTEFKSLLERGL